MGFSDLALSRRLERAEGRSNADFVEARAATFPAVGAAWIERAGAYALFDGVDSPITQTFGLGLGEPGVVAADLDAIEAFFRERGAPVFHEVSPLAELTLFALLQSRGYRLMELTSVLWRALAGAGGPAPVEPAGIVVRVAAQVDLTVWAETSARGWSEQPELTGFMHELAIINTRRRNFVPFLAEIDGTPVAAGGLSVCERVALLAGASTIPEARQRGAQRALLEARLVYAAAHGCDIAMMGALPGSASQRNAERAGFRIAYTRIKWQLPGRASAGSSS